MVLNGEEGKLKVCSPSRRESASGYPPTNPAQTSEQVPPCRPQPVVGVPGTVSQGLKGI